LVRAEVVIFRYLYFFVLTYLTYYLRDTILSMSILRFIQYFLAQYQLSKIELMSDNEIVAEYRETFDPILYKVIYKRYSGKVYHKCLAMLKSGDEAMDATQDIFIKLYTKIADFEERAKLSTWIYRVTYNYCIDMLRRRKKDEKLFSPEGDIPDTEDEIDDSEILQIEVQKLKVVLNKIPEGDKAVLMMKYQDDMSIKEIAAILGKTESSIKMKLKRAKHKTQKVFKETFRADDY